METRNAKRNRSISTNSTIPNFTNATLDGSQFSNALTPIEKLEHLIQAMGKDEKNKQEGGYKRVKCDWFESFEEIQVFNDKKKYQKIQEVGDGTYSRVVSAKNKETSELVAIKKLYMNSREPITLSLLREIKCLMSCEHINIVKFIEVLITMSKLGQKKISIVTELCVTDLYTLNRKRSPITREYYKDFFHQMLIGIEYLHSINIVHRDVKLSNYLISADGIIKLGDFGLGKNFFNEAEPHSPTVVTLCYRPPELLLNDRQYTSAIDIWSLGCCLAEFIIGEPLFCSPTGEIDQLLKIFTMFGVESDDEIFENSSLTFSKKEPSNWKEEILHEALKTELDILQGCFLYDKKKRLTARQILDYSYWKEEPEMKRYIYANFQDNPVVKKSKFQLEEEEEDFSNDEAWYGNGGRALFGKRLMFDSPESDANSNHNSNHNSIDQIFHVSDIPVKRALFQNSPQKQQKKEKEEEGLEREEKEVFNVKRTLFQCYPLQQKEKDVRDGEEILDQRFSQTSSFSKF